MKKYFLTFLVIFTSNSFSQEEMENENKEEITINIIEDIPVFPGCEDIERDYRINCFNLKISDHIKINFKYPKKALKRNIQGRVLVSFIINKEGNIVNIDTRGADPILQTEAYRIVRLLPKMTPGSQRGKPVNVKYTIPITFKLN
jgi:periplasmic protein TonB